MTHWTIHIVLERYQFYEVGKAPQMTLNSEPFSYSQNLEADTTSSL